MKSLEPSPGMGAQGRSRSRQLPSLLRPTTLMVLSTSVLTLVPKAKKPAEGQLGSQTLQPSSG